MKLATLKNGTRDGQLVVVSRNLEMAVEVAHIAATLQQAIENWSAVEPRLQAVSQALNSGTAEGAFAFDPAQAAAPLPRAYQWLDGSAFKSHGQLMDKAFNMEPNPDTDKIPLMYQGAGDDFIGPMDDVILPSEEDGIDFEGEFAVLLDEVPMSCKAEDAEQHIKLILQLNDVSLRAHGPREMRSGFGFLHAKPSSAFAPVAVTPDELGAGWNQGRVCLPLEVRWNDEIFGRPHGSEMHFNFPELIAHAARTRKLGAGTVLGSGTVSNADASVVGSACIAERRALEIIDSGTAKTPFMTFGDRVRMEVRGEDNASVFGVIDQRIVRSADGVSE